MIFILAKRQMHEQHARDCDRTSALLHCLCLRGQLLFDLCFPIPAQAMQEEFLMQHHVCALH